jgi:hypothetical protein
MSESIQPCCYYCAQSPWLWAEPCNWMMHKPNVRFSIEKNRFAWESLMRCHVFEQNPRTCVLVSGVITHHTSIMYVDVCMYVCMHVHACAEWHVCMHMCMCVDMHACMYTHVLSELYVCICVCMYVCMHMQVCGCFVCIQTHPCMCIHSYIYVCVKAMWYEVGVFFIEEASPVSAIASSYQTSSPRKTTRVPSEARERGRSRQGKLYLPALVFWKCSSIWGELAKLEW